MISLLLRVFISATFVFLLAFQSFRRHARKESKLPPGNMSLPFIGETSSFLNHYPTFTRGAFMENHISRFGKIFAANLFGRQTVVSADAELNRFIFKNDGALFTPGWPRAVEKLMGEMSLSFSVGDAHKYIRSMYQKFLSRERLQTVFLQDAEQLASFILSSWKDSTICAQDEANKFSFYIMVKHIFGMGHGEPEMEKIRREYKEFVTGLASPPFYIPGTPYWKAFKSRENIVKVFKGMVEERKKGNDNARTEEDGDFLGWVTKNTTYSTEQIGRLLLHLLLAGHDLISRSICTMIYFLEGCPNAIKQLREEHLQLVESKLQKGDSKLTWEEYKTLEFTQCVINETLRLANIASHIQKKATMDIQFKGYIIPKDCTVIAHISAMHLDPTLFNDPEHFNPWRWMCPSGIVKINEFMPFGGGLRFCIGQELAKLEMTVFLHHLIMKYDWELLEHEQPVTFPIVNFPKGLPVKFRAL